MGLFNLNKKKGSTVSASSVQTSSASKHPYNQLAGYMPYARQSVSELDGVYIKEAELAENEILFTILINDEKRQVSIAL